MKRNVLTFTCLSFLLSLLSPLSFAQEAPPVNESARALLKSSLSFLKDKLKDSDFILNEKDASLIERSGNTFYIPKQLRLKGIASIPVIKEYIRVKQIRFTPESKDQIEPGFQIIKIKHKSIFTKLGLIKADIIHTINGRTVESEKAAQEIFNELKNSDKITLGLFRKNSPLSLNYQFR